MPAEVCSTGEQKALLIAIILANARLMAAERGQPPLLLLDEVAAHLDAERRTALFGEILDLGAQAWLTGTDQPCSPNWAMRPISSASRTPMSLRPDVPAGLRPDISSP